MADVSYLNVSGVTYNIVDQAATSTLNDMKTNINVNDGAAQNPQNTIQLVGATGEIKCTSVETVSARDKKINIESFNDNALDIINNTNVVTFKYKTENDEAMYHVGFIADDTNPILSDKDQRHFRIGDTIGVLIKAVQELSAKNKELEEKLNNLLK